VHRCGGHFENPGRGSAERPAGVLEASESSGQRHDLRREPVSDILLDPLQLHAVALA